MRAVTRLLRRLGRRPGLTAARLATLTIVVASVTAVFAVADATLLKPLPFPHASRLMLIHLLPPGSTAFADATPLDRWEFKRFHAEHRRWDRLEGIETVPMGLSDGGEPESVQAGRVSVGFFDVLGGSIALGRTFTNEEIAGNAKVVVLGDGIWHRRFAGDRGVVGRVVRIDREPYAVIGVMAPGFEPGFTSTEFWTPLFVPQTSPALFTSVRTIGRLPERGTAADGLAELHAMWTQLSSESAVLNGWTVHTIDLHQSQFGSRRPGAWMLLAGAVALMLIATANLTNLTLADVLFRQGDFALSSALGGSRRMIAKPEIGECLLLAGAGAVIGLAGATWLLPALLSLSPRDAASDVPVALDWRVWSATFVASLGVMLGSVAWPVWHAADPRLAIAGAGRRTAGGRGASRVRLILVAGQAALAVVLLATGALVVRAFEQAAATAPGFDPANVLSAQVRLSTDRLPTDADRTAFVRRILEEVRATPGVVAAGVTLNPFVANGGVTTIARIEDQPRPDGTGYSVQFRRVAPGYFETMRIRILEGRAFDDSDTLDRTAVAIVSRAFARKFWGDASPLGRRIKRGSTTTIWNTVIGVADDVRDVGLDIEPAPTLYTSYYQTNASGFPFALVARTAGEAATMEPAIKRAVWAVDASQPLANVRTMRSFLDETLGRRRFRAALVIVFGVIGTLLATIGIYGVTARSVAERSREIGIRLALGGEVRAVWVRVAWSSARAVALGAAVGVGLALAATRGLAALMPEITGTAWLAGLAAAVWLLATGVAAAMIAARGVLRVEPASALRAP